MHASLIPYWGAFSFPFLYLGNGTYPGHMVTKTKAYMCTTIQCEHDYKPNWGSIHLTTVRVKS